MSRTGPLLHILTILVLVVPAAFLLAARDDPATAEEGAPAGRVTLTPDDWPAEPAAVRGRVVFERWCIGCHGDAGEGNGPAARWLNPLPRNFQSGQFKFRSTPSGSLPTADDLLHTVTCGLAGSAMPGFPLVPLQDRRDVVAYVLHLASLGMAKREVEYLMDEEGMTLDEIRADTLPDLREELRDKVRSVKKIAVPPAPDATPEMLAKGKEVFDVQCAACHGATGRGDGSSSYTLRDYKDSEIRPRDFTTGVFRSGSTPEDLYRRLRTGLMGTPMPAIPGSDDDIWALVHYILSLRDPSAQPTWVPPVCGGGEVSR